MTTAFENLAPRVMGDLIFDFGLTPEQAAGVVGNLGAESGLRAVQEARPIRGRGGFGWAQWTGPRRVAFERWCGECGLEQTSYAANYGYLKAELSGAIPSFDYRHTISQVKKTTTVKAATETFEAHYEKAGVKRISARLACANRALALFQASGNCPVQPKDHVMPKVTIPTPEVKAPLPNPEPKPWYQSKAVIGGLLAILLPPLAAAFPAFKLVDPNTAADYIVTAVQFGGPFIGGILAIFGRMSATQPIAGTQAAQEVQEAHTTTELTPTNMADVAVSPRLMSMPLGVILEELPIMIEAIEELRQVAQPLAVPRTLEPVPLRNGSDPALDLATMAPQNL